jgi:hypothetical protein
VLTLIVALAGKVFFEEFICEDARLGWPIHAFLNLDINLSIGVNNVGEPILVDNFLGKDLQPEVHVFVALHWDVQLEVGKVNTGQGQCRRKMHRE